MVDSDFAVEKHAETFEKQCLVIEINILFRFHDEATNHPVAIAICGQGLDAQVNTTFKELLCDIYWQTNSILMWAYLICLGTVQFI